MSELKFLGGQESVVINAAAQEGGPSVFNMKAYSGAEMNVYLGYQVKRVVVDVDGIQLTKKPRPILAHHDPRQIVGHTTKISKTDGALHIEGVISGVGAAAQEVIGASENGFPWQASVGLSVKKAVEYEDGKTVTVNGRQFSGPIVVVRSSKLNESSFVPLGADDDTEAKMVASFEGASFGGIEMAKEGEVSIDASAPDKDAAGKESHVNLSIDAGAISDAVTSAAEMAIKAERARVAKIKELCAGEFPEVEAAAISGGESAEDVTPKIIKAMREKRANVPAIHIGAGAGIDGDTLEAAALMAGKISNIEKHASEKSLEAAHKAFKRGVGLQEMLLHAAWANGCNCRTFRENPREILRFAFGDARLNASFSTIDIGGILSNVANKFMLEAFGFVEQSWREIAAIRNVSDFKTITSYRMIGAGEYQKVEAGGEIKHGTLGEEYFTNKANTYGLMLSVTRQDIVNDDMGALTAAPTMLGRGAGLKLNRVFWTEFMNNASFFTGATNYIDGADSVLGLTGLEKGLVAFAKKTDGNGQILGLRAAKLLVPPALEATAQNLFKSLEMRDTTASTKYTTNNPYAGQYQPVVSAYLTDSTITGNSATAWYLLADPRAVATVEVAFLNGVETPMIETSEADFNTLGIQMRGTHDFGVTKQDVRGGLKSKGAAA